MLLFHRRPKLEIDPRQETLYRTSMAAHTQPNEVESVSHVNIVKKIKIDGDWKLRSIPRNAKGNYDWNALCEGLYLIDYLEKWMDQLRWQRLKPFEKLADTLLKHLDG